MSSDLIIRKGTPEDGESLAPRLRAADALELELAGATIRQSIKLSSEVWAVEEEGTVIALAGLALVERTNAGVPWMVGSDDLLKHPIRLVREGRLFVARWEKQCAVLTNFVHAENLAGIEWLKCIGFEMGQTFPQWGPGKAPFIQFQRHSTCAV